MPTIIPRRPAPVDPLAQFVETPQQIYERFNRDYFAWDRPQVLEKLRAAAGYGPDPNAPKAPAGGWPTTPPNPGTTNPNGTSNAGFDLAKLKAGILAIGGKATAEALKTFIEAHPEFATGVTIGGSKNNKLYGPNGQYLGKAIQATDSANPTWTWDEEGGAGGGGTGGAMYGNLPDMTATYGVKFDPTTAAKPPAAQPYGKEFTQPTLEEIRAMPGYQFTRDEGLKAIDAMAASRGTAFSSGENQDLAKYATGLADTFAQRAFDNKKAAFGTNYDIFQNDQQAKNTEFTLGLQGTSNALDTYKTMYDVWRGDRNDIFGRFERASALGAGAADRATS